MTRFKAASTNNKRDYDLFKCMNHANLINISIVVFINNLLKYNDYLYYFNLSIILNISNQKTVNILL